MKKLFFLLSIAVFCGACNNDSGQLIFIEKSTEKGFQFPYFLYIPEGTSQTDSLILIIEPNNSGFADDDFDKHIEKAERTASKDFYMGNYIARSLKYPLLVPVFPRSASEWKIYTHALDRDVMVQNNNALERIDLQLLAMVEDAKKRLSLKSYSVLNQFFITGFSASGTFANRFTLLHPEKVLATAAGGLNGLLMLPIKSLDNLPLNYPIGVNDYQSLFGKKFDSTAFKSTPQYYFFGELDDNDAIPYEDGYDDDERTLIYKLLGENMHTKRWVNCTKIYQQEQVNAKIVSYPGIGHEQTYKIKEDVLEFFKSCIGNKPSSDIAELCPQKIIEAYFSGFNNTNFNQISDCISDSILITEGDFVITKSKKDLYTNFQWDSVFSPKYQVLEINVIDNVFETTVSKIDQRIKFLQDTSITYKIIINIIDNQIIKMQTNDYVQFDFLKWQSRRDSLEAWVDNFYPQLSGFLDVQTKDTGMKYLKAINLYKKTF